MSDIKRRVVDEILDGELPKLPDWFVIGVRCALEDYPFVGEPQTTDPAELMLKLGEILEHEPKPPKRVNKKPYIDCGDTNIHRPHASGKELQRILAEHGEDYGLRMKSGCGKWGKITLDDSMPLCGDCFGRYG